MFSLKRRLEMRCKRVRRDSLSKRLFNSRKKLLSVFVLVMFALSVFASTFMLSPSVLGNPAFGDPGFIAYRSSSGAGVSIPKYRSWSADTNTWASESALATAGSPVRWVRVAYSPNVTRKEERIVVTLSDNGNLYAYVWSGTTWSQTLIASVGTTVNAYRCFDIAYEMKTGRALVVYSRGTATLEIGYRIWNGESWSSEAQLEARTTGVVNWIALASAPGTRSGTGDDNEIAMIYLAADPAVHGYVWTGAAWSEMGVVAIWDTSIAIATEESIAVAYEQNSGKAMFIWADSVISDFYYRVWSGTTLSGPTLRDIPGSDGLGNWLSLKSSPSSNGLLFGVVDAGSDLNTAYWSGTTWTVHTEHDGTVDTHAQRCFDVEWAADGTHAMLLWGTTLSSVSWRKLTPPNTWTTEATIPAEGLNRPWVQLRRPPYPIRVATGTAPQIVGATLDAVLDIDIFQWDGSAWTRTADITTDTGVSTYECFEVEFQSINPKVTVSPASIIDTGATYAPQTPIIINPDGDGTFADWTGSYTDWDDWPAHDGDTTYVSSTVDYSYQSSTLSDPAGPPTWTIAKVKIYIVARNTDPDSDDELIPLLVIGGWEYEGKRFTPTSTYETYTTEWAMNPDTDSYWTWADIADLEAGALSSQYGFWPGELRVTQIYVEITGPRLSVDIRVDYVRDLWLFEFELTYNPDLLKGVYYDEAWGWPVKVGDFLGSAGGSVGKNGGIGWNNTLGKLWLNGAFLTGTSPANCPDGNGILATVVFEVVAQGETTLHLGELTGLMYPPPPTNNYMAKGLAFVEDGYFRNVASAEIPTTSFTVTPQDPIAGIIEGKNVTFTSTSSASGGKTIITYKWCYWKSLQESFYERFPAGQSPFVTGLSTVTRNFTLRGTWPVTLTVIDSAGVVGSTTVDVLIKAHDIYVKTITTNASFSKYPMGTPYIDLGETVQIDVLVENQGDFGETFDLNAYWSNPFGPEGSIGTHTGISLGIGTSTTRTFYWTPTGVEFCIIHALPFGVVANTSLIQYEYDVGDNTNSFPGPRIRFHNLVVSELETASALVLKPNGDGAYTGWTGVYTDWDEWPIHDSDSTFVSAAAGGLDESSLLTDHTAEAWTISKVRLKVFAKNTVASDEALQLMLVVGGTRYLSTTRFTPTTTYGMYMYDWPTNPATGLAWTWPQIDALQAGVRSVQVGGSWTGELRVTQLCVEVLATPTENLFSTTGQWVAVLATVANEGDYNQTNIDVTTYCDSTIPATAPTQRIPLLTNSSLAISFAGLGIKSSETLSFIWDTTAVPWGTCTIKANATIAVADVKPRDNTGTGPGDINGDGWVDVGDLILMHQAFGSKPGDSNWIASADLNNDSIVNVDDLRLLGKSYWPPTP